MKQNCPNVKNHPFLLIFQIVTCFLLLFEGAIPSSPLYAKSRAPKEKAFDGHLRWGSCYADDEISVSEGQNSFALGQELSSSMSWPILCVNPKIAGQLFIRDDTGSENSSFISADLYHGLYVQSWVSLHGRYLASRLTYLGAKSAVRERSSTVIDNARTENLYLQLGNAALNRWRLSLGKIDPAFGINDHALPEVFEATIRTNRYWTSPEVGAMLVYDTLVSSVIEVSVHTNTLLGLEYGDEYHSAVGIRSMFDVGILEGLRFVVSGYGENTGERRVGAGAINVTGRGDTTTLEWVRLSPGANLYNADLMQTFRFNFQSAFRSGTRFIFDFESERKNYRMGTFGVDASLPDYGLLRFTTSIYNGWFADQGRYLLITVGTQIAL